MVAQRSSEPQQQLPGVLAHCLPSAHRKGGSGPRRSLSVEDIGAPARLRAVGRVVEVFPDGTSQLELQRPPSAAFGFCLTSGNGRPDTGTVEVSHLNPAGLVPPQQPAWGWVEQAAPAHGAAEGGGGQAHAAPRGFGSSRSPCPGHKARSECAVSKATCSAFVGAHRRPGVLTLSLSTGVYVQEMADAGTAKLYAGLLGVGDEILQVNGTAVSALGLPRIQQLLLQADTLSLRVLRHRPAPRQPR